MCRVCNIFNATLFRGLAVLKFVDIPARKFTAPGGITIAEGDVVSVNGTSGEVYLGEVVRSTSAR
jgi:hypothetical protein